MANRFQQFLLVFGLTGLVANTAICADNDEDGTIKINPIKVVEPNVQQRRQQEAKIDSEFFEIGAYTGLISVEDFSSTSVFGFKASFHATEDFFLQANYGRATVGKTSYERLTGENTSILTDEEREFKYYDLLIGYNLFPGETFVTQNLTFNSAFYVVAGAGDTEFAGDHHFTAVLGTGYRIILNDWITWNLDYRDHIFESELLGEEKQTHNLELTSGVTFFF